MATASLRRTVREVVHEESLRDALGVVQRVVGERQALGGARGEGGAAVQQARSRGCKYGCVDHQRAEVLPEEDAGVADLAAQVLERERIVGLGGGSASKGERGGGGRLLSVVS